MVRQIQLYMWAQQRRHFIERHDFYVEQTKKRVLAQFSDIESEATKVAHEAYEAGAKSYWREDGDLSDVADAAQEAGIERYELLSDLKAQVMQGALAGIFHQWEKDLRGFLEQEFRHHFKEPEKLAWERIRTVEDIFSMLDQEFGWPCQTEAFYPKIDACRMIVNVYKHGKGASFRDLLAKYPQYLAKTGFESKIWLLEFLDYEALEITEEVFDDLAAAIREFWIRIPENLYYVDAKNS